MNKFIFILPFTLFFQVSQIFAQSESERGFTDQGRIIIGTSAGLSLTGVRIDGVDDTFLNIGVNTSGGYFVINNLAVNLQLDYQYTRFGDESESTLNIGPTIRYYFPPRIFIGTGYLISVPSEGESTGFVPIELGYAYFITRNIALEPALGVLIGAHNNSTFAYSLNLGFGIYLR